MLACQILVRSLQLLQPRSFRACCHGNILTLARANIPHCQRAEAPVEFSRALPLDHSRFCHAKLVVCVVIIFVLHSAVSAAHGRQCFDELRGCIECRAEHKRAALHSIVALAADLNSYDVLM